MGPDINFWIVAWSMMGLAFITATLAIVLGARGLDRKEINRDESAES